ncbi:MAG: sugar phosphate isomerase/epimerase [Treponema sp.]|nr:sugar phosphate isomerase/epimerase [Treponema sp.]
MKYGIYYAYWEKQWGGDYLKYIKKVKKLGFDILEISCAGLAEMPAKRVKELAAAASDSGVELTGGYGPKPEENIASPDAAVVDHAFDFWKRTFDVLAALGIKSVGGGLYSYWPVDFGKPFNKKEDLKRSISGMKKLGHLAEGYHITLGMEVLNRFEGYLLNTAAEALAYVKAVGRDNVKVMLDTFHMNIEEDSLVDAIKTAGPYLGHFHLGEPNRLPPHAGSRMDWPGIGKALNGIGYSGTVVMEPFVLQGGQVGKDIKVWRDLAPSGQSDLDEAARKSVEFIRKSFGGK